MTEVLGRDVIKLSQSVFYTLALYIRVIEFTQHKCPSKISTSK